MLLLFVPAVAALPQCPPHNTPSTRLAAPQCPYRSEDGSDDGSDGSEDSRWCHDTVGEGVSYIVEGVSYVVEGVSYRTLSSTHICRSARAAVSLVCGDPCSTSRASISIPPSAAMRLMRREHRPETRGKGRVGEGGLGGVRVG